MWQCRRCGYRCDEPDKTGCRIPGPGDQFYRAPLCPNCGQYFNEADMSAAALAGYREVSPAVSDPPAAAETDGTPPRG
jgi:hypothetical protein